MADVLRYRWGDTNPVVCAVITIQAVSIGDVIGLSSGNAYRAEDHAWTNLSATQFNFCANFLGVASQRKVANSAQTTGGGAANRMRVDTEGVFEFNCPATTFEIGNLVGMEQQSTTTLLESQKVALVTDVTRAIGRIAEKKTNTSTTCKVAIFSKIMIGGPQA